MRRELSAKETIYNSFSYFPKGMNLPLIQSKHLGRYLDDERQQICTSFAKSSTLYGKNRRKELKALVDNYPLCGPMGSQDPILPISINRIRIEIAAEKGNLAQKWKKEAVCNWFAKLGNERNDFKPTRMAAV